MYEAFLLLAPVLLGLGGGISLDRSFGTVPLWTIVLTLTGIVAGIWMVIKQSERSR